MDRAMVEQQSLLTGAFPNNDANAYTLQSFMNNRMNRTADTMQSVEAVNTGIGLNQPYILTLLPEDCSRLLQIINANGINQALDGHSDVSKGNNASRAPASHGPKRVSRKRPLPDPHSYDEAEKTRVVSELVENIKEQTKRLETLNQENANNARLMHSRSRMSSSSVIRPRASRNRVIEQHEHRYRKTPTNLMPLQSIIVPSGWDRKIVNDVVYYVSPSGNKLNSLDSVRNYLLDPHSCKCGLQCPVILEQAFSFDPNIKSYFDTAENGPGMSLCRVLDLWKLENNDGADRVDHVNKAPSSKRSRGRPKKNDIRPLLQEYDCSIADVLQEQAHKQKRSNENNAVTVNLNALKSNFIRHPNGHRENPPSSDNVIFSQNVLSPSFDPTSSLDVLQLFKNDGNSANNLVWASPSATAGYAIQSNFTNSDNSNVSNDPIQSILMNLKCQPNNLGTLSDTDSMNVLFSLQDDLKTPSQPQQQSEQVQNLVSVNNNDVFMNLQSLDGIFNARSNSVETRQQNSVDSTAPKTSKKHLQLDSLQ